MYQDTTIKILRSEDDSNVWEPFNPYVLENAQLIVQALNGFPEIEMKKFREELAQHEQPAKAIEVPEPEDWPEGLI